MSNVIAVIHYKNYLQAFDNAMLARRAGCWGAALIDMRCTLAGDLEAVEAARQIALRMDHASGFKVGANSLVLPPADAVLAHHMAKLDFSWVDDAGIRPHPAPVPQEAWNLLSYTSAFGTVQRGDRRQLYEVFVGAAFKTHGGIEGLPGDAALRVANLGWIPTTSGPGTGVPPTSAKLRSMAAALGGPSRLAVASGVSPQNAWELAPHAGWIFAATAVSRDEHNLHEEILTELVEKAKRLGAAPA